MRLFKRLSIALLAAALSVTLAACAPIVDNQDNGTGTNTTINNSGTGTNTGTGSTGNNSGTGTNTGTGTTGNNSGTGTNTGASSTTTTKPQRATITVELDPVPVGAAYQYSAGGTYNVGDTVTMSVYVGKEYIFTGWKKNGVIVCTQNDYTFTVTESCTLVATFKKAEEATEAKTFTLSNGVVVNATQSILGENSKTYQVIQKYSGKPHTVEGTEMFEGLGTYDWKFVTDGTKTYMYSSNEILTSEYLYEHDCYYRLNSTAKTYVKVNVGVGNTYDCFLFAPSRIEFPQCYSGVAVVDGQTYYAEVFQNETSKVIYTYCYKAGSDTPSYMIADFSESADAEYGWMTYKFTSIKYDECDTSLLSLDGYTEKN